MIRTLLGHTQRQPKKVLHTHTQKSATITTIRGNNTNDNKHTLRVNIVHA